MIPLSSGMSSPDINLKTDIKTPVFDFKTGDFVFNDGKIAVVDGILGVKLYIEKVLRTPKGRYEIYKNTGYGVNIEDLIVGSNYPVEFVQSEVQREITEALLKNKAITAVNNFAFERTVSGLNVTFNVDTALGGSFESGVVLVG